MILLLRSKKMWFYIFTNAKRSFSIYMQNHLSTYMSRQVKDDDNMLISDCLADNTSKKMPSFQGKQKETNIHGMSEMFASGLLWVCRWRAERLGEGVEEGSSQCRGQRTSLSSAQYTNPMNGWHKETTEALDWRRRLRTRERRRSRAAPLPTLKARQ